MSEEKNKSMKDYVESVKDSIDSAKNSIDSAKNSIETKAAELYNHPIGQQTHTLGLVSFIMAIIGIFSSFLFPFAIQIIGIILGHVASSDIKANPGRYSGAGLVTAGLIINYLFLLFALFGFLLLIKGLGSVFNSGLQNFFT